MKKIPTIFERDWNGDRSRVLDQINPEAQWVFDGEGIATRKIDGTSCMIRDGGMFKRREVTSREMHDKPVAGFELIDTDLVTDKAVGWVPVGDGPEDRWHREAFEREAHWPNGTYELIGPKVQGNPEAATTNKLVAHEDERLILADSFPRTFESIRAHLESVVMEGIVFHHPDGRMAKIKARDFGLKWPRATSIVQGEGE